jgi:hypothetical protein
MSDRYVLIGRSVIPEPDLFTWGAWVEDLSNRVVKQEQVGNVWVSTVFMGLDHRFGQGPPLLFETMAFYLASDRDKVSLNLQYRCSTWLEAEEQHERAMLEASEIGFQLHAIAQGIAAWWSEFKHYCYWLVKPVHQSPWGGGPCLQCWKIRAEHREFF